MERVAHKALLSMLAVRHDRGSSRLELLHRVFDGPLIHAVEALARDATGLVLFNERQSWLDRLYPFLEIRPERIVDAI